MADTIFYALYKDDDELKGAAKKLVDQGIFINDVFSPFPIHGIDPIIGVKKTRMGIVAFIFGITGTILALIGFQYFMISDWPMDIGGKPNQNLFFNLPAFIPVTFEFTVLLAAHGMSLTYLIRNKTLPGLPSENPDPRTTDDHFAIKVVQSENREVSGEKLEELLKDTGIVELNQKILNPEDEA
jgi:hypothetical protein